MEKRKSDSTKFDREKVKNILRTSWKCDKIFNCDTLIFLVLFYWGKAC